VVYAAYRKEVPLLDAGRCITGWRLGEGPAELPPAARGKVWVARIPRGWEFKQLFLNGRSLPRSASE